MKISHLLIIFPLFYGSDLIAESSCDHGTIKVRTIITEVKQPHKFIEDNLRSDWLKFIYHPTKRSTIEKHLVIKEGDVFNVDDIQESIRNLRATSFIWDAEYQIIPINDCNVDIKLIIHDTFPFKPKISYSRRSGTTSSAIGIESTNIFGSGNKLQLLFKQDKLRKQKIVEFRNPNFTKEHYTANLFYSDNSDGDQKLIQFAKPFFQLDSTSAFNFLWRDFNGDLQLFNDSSLQIVSPYSTTQSVAGFGIGKPEQFNFEHSRWSFSVIQNKTLYQEFNDNDRDIISLNTTINLFDSDFIAIKNLRNMSKNEDYNRGLNVSLNIAASYERLSKTWGPSVSLSVAKNFVFDEYSVLLTSSRFRIRSLGLNSDESRFFGRVEWNYFSHDFQQSWNAKFRWDSLLNPTPENYIIMDDEYSIRGYPYGYRVGDRMFSLNLEKRWFNLAKYFDIVDIAAVLFYDVGIISVKQSELFSQQQTTLQSGGIGLRMSPTKLSNDVVIHIDLAFPKADDLDQSYQLNFFGLTHF